MNRSQRDCYKLSPSELHPYSIIWDKILGISVGYNQLGISLGYNQLGVSVGYNQLGIGVGLKG